MKINFFKRTVAAALCGAVALAAAGCGSAESGTALANVGSGSDKLNVVCTGFSEAPN